MRERKRELKRAIRIVSRTVASKELEESEREWICRERTSWKENKKDDYIHDRIK